MKKVLLLSVMAMLLSSCLVKKAYSVSWNLIDYTKYADDNFFMTESNSVSFEYKSLGSIIVYSNSGYEVKGVKQIENSYYEDEQNLDYGKWKHCDVNDAFKKLHDVALVKGANGVINIKYEYFPMRISDKKIIEENWVVTGMLIKK